VGENTALEYQEKLVVLRELLQAVGGIAVPRGRFDPRQSTSPKETPQQRESSLG
jgi:hypothetical protein